MERAIFEGNLHPGDQLPPQREFADPLWGTLGTVTRGYKEVRRCGLLVGETGRGTFLHVADTYTLFTTDTTIRRRQQKHFLRSELSCS
ncbi:GntR family transcriptional regulator [Desulfopila aestuarii]|uniref:GntR family transcriptional regulator n=1 Tax=Desulfopila aestuarii TaxID=231440 RepID=UPI0009FF073F